MSETSDPQQDQNEEFPAALPQSRRARKKASKLAKRSKVRPRKTKGRGIYVLGGIVIVAISVGAFIFLLSSTQTDTKDVLVANVAINEDDTVFRDNFDVEKVPSDSSVLSLAPNAFEGILDGSVVALVDIAEGTVVTSNMFLVAGSEDGGIERRVEFSISIPAQGFASGPPRVGDRMLLIAYVPGGDPDFGDTGAPEFSPLIIERVTSVNGGRVSFFATPDRAALVQVRQLNIAQKSGYMIIWLVSADQDESESLGTAFRAFQNAY